MGLFDRFRRKSAAEPQQPAKLGNTRADNKAYRGVEVVADTDDCCQSVRDLEGQRFLMSQVPMLPLAACDAADCQCTYERFDDRRTDLRRTADVAFDVVAQYSQDENRSDAKPGRRNDD